MTENVFITKWIDEMAALTQPDQIVWIDGSAEQTEQLREQATITNAIRNAWSSLQRYGKQLWAEVDRNARVQKAEERAARAEQQTREDARTIQRLTQRATAAEEQVREQEQFMKSQGIWSRFLQLIEERQWQRQEQVHHRIR